MSSPPESRNSAMGMNMITTVLAFSVSAFFVLFVFTRLLCARLQLRAAAAEHADDAAFPAITVERSISGMEPTVVTSFPTVKFGDDSHQPPVKDESQCTVCLDEYDPKDVVRVLPYCGHAFHVACIDAWLKQHSTCPICRASMRATAKHHRAAAAMPPVYYADVRATQHFPVAVPSSDPNTFISETAPAAGGTDHMDATASRLEIVCQEPASTASASASACPSAPPAPAAAACDFPSTAAASQYPHQDASENC